MVRLRITVTALAIAAAVIFASSRLSDAALKPLPVLQHGLTIVAFGSSSTQGVGASSPAAAYPAQLESMLRRAMPRTARVTVVNRGVGGEDVDDMMLRLDRDVLGPRPDLVIWQTGSNDPLRHVPLERFEAKTRAGLAALRNADISVVLMEPQWCPKLEAMGTADGYRAIIRRIGAEMGIPVIRRADLMHEWVRSGQVTLADMLSPDGLHMRDAGYRLLAGRVAEEVMRLESATATVSVASATP